MDRELKYGIGGVKAQTTTFYAIICKVICNIHIYRLYAITDNLKKLCKKGKCLLFQVNV